MALLTKVLHRDTEHAWLAVKLSELKMFGIENKVSELSRTKGQTVYLDKDIDLATYVEAARAKGVRIEVSEGALRKRSPIRSFKKYTTEI